MILSICDVPSVLKVIKIIKTVITIIKIAVPIILMISAMIDLVKAITNAELNKMTKTIVSKVISAILVFLIPTFVDLIFTITMTENTYNNCFNNATDENIKAIYISTMDELINKAKTENSIESIGTAKNYLVNIDDKELRTKYEKELNDLEKEIEKKREEERKKQQEEFEKQQQQGSPSGPGYNPGGTFTGNKFSVNEDDLFFITKVSVCEQGSVAGAAAEASLIANRYDLYGKKKYSNITDYVRNSGWWSCAKSKRTINVKDEHIAAVRDVIINGVRTLPLYVDEHDCFDCNKSLCSNGNRGDICDLVTNGKTYTDISYIKNRSNYVSGQTVIHNKYGGTYTFYCFPTQSSDPFGYTQTGYKRAMGN